MFLRTVRDPLHRVGPKEAFGARQWNTGNRHESRILNHHDPPWAKAWTPILAAWATGYLGAKASSGKGAPGVNGLGTFTDQKCLKVTTGYKRLLIVVVFVQLLLKGLCTSFHLISRHIPMYPLSGVTPPKVGETFRCLKRSRISKGICRRTSWFAAPRSSVLQLIMVLDDQGGWFMSWGKYAYKFRF